MNTSTQQPGCTCAWAPREACDLHHNLVPTVSLDVWVEAFEGFEDSYEVRYIANGPSGQQPWSGRFDTGDIEPQLFFLVDLLCRETGWKSCDIVTDASSTTITHYHITQGAS